MYGSSGISVAGASSLAGSTSARNSAVDIVSVSLPFAEHTSSKYSLVKPTVKQCGFSLYGKHWMRWTTSPNSVLSPQIWKVWQILSRSFGQLCIYYCISSCRYQFLGNGSKVCINLCTHVWVETLCITHEHSQLWTCFTRSDPPPNRVYVLAVWFTPLRNTRGKYACISGFIFRNCTQVSIPLLTPPLAAGSRSSFSFSTIRSS